MHYVIKKNTAPFALRWSWTCMRSTCWRHKGDNAWNWLSANSLLAGRGQMSAVHFQKRSRVIQFPVSQGTGPIKKVLLSFPLYIAHYFKVKLKPIYLYSGSESYILNLSLFQICLYQLHSPTVGTLLLIRHPRRVTCWIYYSHVYTGTHRVVQYFRKPTK